MSQRLPVLLIALAVVIALATGAVTYNWLVDRANTPVEEPKAIPTVQVAVATSSLVRGTTLNEDMVRLVAFPAESLPEGYVSQPQDLKGRILLRDLQPNEAILSSTLVPLKPGAGKIAALMGPKKRAMAVKVDEVVGVAGFVQPGDHVDVLVTFQRPGRSSDVVTKIVLVNTLVLATGTDIERQADGEPPKQVKVITLEVTPREAEKLALAATRGTLRLALRSPLDEHMVKTPGATPWSLLASHRPAAKAKARPKKHSVEVIRGSTVTKETF